MKTYKTVSELAEAMKSDEIPANVVSPGAAAAMLGVTRQAINDRLHNGDSLEAWSAEGIVLISVRSIRLARRKKLLSAKNKK